VESRDAVVLTVLGASWGSSFLFMKIAIQDTDAFTIAFGRLAIGALMLLAILAAQGGTLARDRGLLLKLAFLGVVNNSIPFTLIAWAEQFISAGLGALLNALVPIFAVLVATAAIAEERLSGARVAGVVVGFGGVAVAVGFWEEGFLEASLAGVLAVAVSSFLYAVSTHFARRYLPKGRPTEMACLQLSFGAVALAPLSLLLSWGDPVPAPPSIVSIYLLGLVGSGFAYLLYFRLLPRIGATRLTLVTYLIPAFAMLWAFLIISEEPTWFNLLGLVVIVTGIALVERGRSGAAAPRRQAEIPPPSHLTK
jgi:drug/metabolite transporter (DMT)-like permease